MEKLSKLGEYNGKEDSDKHMQLVNKWLNCFSADKVSK